jgi:hypothetical protein
MRMIKSALVKRYLRGKAEYRCREAREGENFQDYEMITLKINFHMEI